MATDKTTVKAPPLKARQPGVMALGVAGESGGEADDKDITDHGGKG